MTTRFIVLLLLGSFLLTAYAAEWQNLTITACPDLKAPPMVAIPDSIEPATIDGQLKDVIWEKAANIDNLPMASGGTPEATTSAMVARHGNNLYVAVICEEPTFATRHVTAKTGEDNWPGDAVEVFIDAGGTGFRHFQFVTSAEGAKNDWGPGADREWNGEWEVATAKTETHWVAEYRIALDQWDFPLDRHVWGLNITRQRMHMIDGALFAELSSWAPVGETFHATDRFGKLFFGSEKLWNDRQRIVRLEGVLDRDRYSTLHARALLAINLLSGHLNNTTVALNLSDSAGNQLRSTVLNRLPSRLAGVELPIGGLPTGAYKLSLQPASPDAPAAPAVVLDFSVEHPDTEPRRQGSIVLRQTQPLDIDLDAWHLRTGVPFAIGELTDPDQIQLRLGDEPIPVQSRTLASWGPGGSIKWLRLDAQVPIRRNIQQELTLVYGPEIEPVPSPSGITITEDEAAYLIDTGVARFRVRRHAFNGIDRMWIGENLIAQADDTHGPFMADAQRRYFRSSQGESTVVVEEAGPLCTVLRAEGTHGNGDEVLGRYIVRLSFFAGRQTVGLQHTFIITENTNTTQYADIGFALPFTGNRHSFGLDSDTQTGAGDTWSLHQQRWDRCVVSRIEGGERSIVASGQRGTGQGTVQTDSAQSISLLVRDFWQNFPSEITSSSQALTYHAWPRNGIVVDPDRHYDASNIWRFWFCHEGELLDFRFPTSHNPPEMDKEARWAGDAAAQSNAIGLAKTTDMLIAFGTSADTTAALNTAFQSGLHVLPDPAHIAASQVAGNLSVADPERFPVAEAYYSDGFDFVVRSTLELNHAYGMFNYGDSFTHWKTDEPHLPPSYLRLWNGYHHGRPRIPWLLYMRSGNPKYLHWGMANTAHVADIDTCHYAPLEFQHHRQWASRKAVGGMCDYKGTVHWHTGHRVDYNSMTDFLLYGYYLTANARWWDVCQEIGQYLTDTAVAQPSRHGGGVISAGLDYFKATWNPHTIFRIRHEYFPKMLIKPAFEHRPPSIGWAPYLEPYYRYTGDPRAARFLLDFAEHRFTDQATHRLHSHHYGDGRALALATELSGDRRYALSGLAYIELGPLLYQRPEDIRNGLVDWYPYSYSTMQSVYALATAADLDPPPQPLEIPYWHHSGGPGSPGIYWKGAKRRTLTILLPELADQTFEVGGRYASYGSLDYVLHRPDGTLKAEGSLPRPKDDRQQLFLTVPEDGQTGTYTLTITGSSAFYFHYSAISDLPTVRFAMPAATDNSVLRMTDSARWYFYVPEDCHTFAIHVTGKLIPKQALSTADIYNPSGDHVLTRSLPLGEEAILSVEPRPDQRGKWWSLAGYELNIRQVDGLAPWFAARPVGPTP